MSWGNEVKIAHEDGGPAVTTHKLNVGEVDKRNVYFRNLHGLRFIAALLVIVHHAEQFKSMMRIDNDWSVPAVRLIGKLGVILFFVLSGFLITYLLLAEERTFHTISVRKFYARRILRIWPLYFLIIATAFLIMPNIPAFSWPGYGKNVVYSNLELKLILYSIFLPNVAHVALGTIPYAAHTWSIGVEEQYYLVWPVFVKHIKKCRVTAMLLIVLGYVAIEQFLTSRYAHAIPYSTVVRDFWAISRIDCMAIGGIYTTLLFYQHRILRILLHPVLFYVAAVASIALMAYGVKFPNGTYEFYAVQYGLLILNLAANPRIKISLENRVLHYLGNISYGIYMYHPVGIVVAVSIAAITRIHSNWLIYPLSLGVTVGLAGLSYRYFEGYFLKFKTQFTNIRSSKDEP